MSRQQLHYTLVDKYGATKVVGEPPGTMHISDAAEAFRLKLRVNERHEASVGVARYFAKFEGLEVIEGSLRCGSSGNGQTPRAAIQDYLLQVSGKHCATGGYSAPRYFDMPHLYL